MMTHLAPDKQGDGFPSAFMIAPEWFSFADDTSSASWLLLLPVVSALIYWAISLRFLGRWLGRAPTPIPADLPPATFFRPVKPHLHELETKAAALLSSARAGDTILFGVSTMEDELRCLAACRTATPAGAISRVIRCEPPPLSTQNPKIAKLIALTEALEADAPAHWIISDSEALPTRAMLDAFRAEWLASGHTAFTAGYRFSSPSNGPELIDRLPLLLTLWPGLLAAESGGRGNLGFALGACMAVHRDHLEAIGGWRRLLPYLAEDNRLGRFLAAQGRTTGLSRQILPLEGDPQGWRSALRHQHRVAFTYRVCNPWGTLGMALTHGIPYALLFTLCQPASPFGWSLALLVIMARTAQARAMGRRLKLLSDLPLPRFVAGIIGASLVEWAAWWVAWLPLPVRWNDRALRVDRHGRFRTSPQDTAPNRHPADVSLRKI